MPNYIVNVEDQPLVANTPQTILMISAPSTRRVVLVEWGISFAGVSAAEAPVLVEVRRYTTAGTGTPFTPIKMREVEPAALAAGTTIFTVEPTSTELLFPYRVTPNGGLFVIQYPLGREPSVNVSGRLGLTVRAGAAVAATAYLVYEE